MFSFKPLYVRVASFQPGHTQRLDPAGKDTFDIGTLFGNEFILWGVRISNDQVGHVGGEVQFVDGAHL